MMFKTLLLVYFCALSALAQKGPTPEEVNGPGKGGGGAFGGNMFLSGRPPVVPKGAPATPNGSVLMDSWKGSIGNSVADFSGGSGPLTSAWYSEPTFPNHTIYAPIRVDPSVKLPLLVWGNGWVFSLSFGNMCLTITGGCRADGSRFANFLTEIASHGFMVLANGPNGMPFGTTAGRDGPSMISAKNGNTQAYQLTESVNWALAGAANGKYGAIDTSKIAVAGQSCGGIEAYSAAYKDERIKQIGIFNSGVIDAEKRPLLTQIKQPVAFFIGGPSDIAYKNVSKCHPSS
jgi:hypothetical protein